MDFNIEFDYEVIVTFSAPLLGYNISDVYGPKADELAKKSLIEMLTNDLDSITKSENGMVCVISKSKSDIRRT